LEGGYQIGYTNGVVKGMSGGPLLNHDGELVGINGIHGEPLWEVVYLYEDGSEPDAGLQGLIAANSWAVPMERLQGLGLPMGRILNFFRILAPGKVVYWVWNW
jgi:hypothetical protein